MTLSIRFICQDPQDTQEQLKLEQTFWVRDNLGTIVDMMCKALHIPRRPTINQDSERQIAELDGAIAEAAGGLRFGWCTIVLTVIDPDPELATFRARQLLKDLNALGFNARIEDANATEAIYGSWPGNGWHNCRRPMISVGNFWELALPVEYYAGTPNIDSPFFAQG
jgi:type IV secretion system protein VirB4